MKPTVPPPSHPHHDDEVCYHNLFDNNDRWVEKMLETDPEYFKRMSAGQSPTFLFVGCSDSRVPAQTITGTGPGEMFIHRNIANQALPNDLNFLAVLQYSVEVLKVKHIIVCGHYGCGGVKAALEGRHNGLLDTWLYGIKKVYQQHSEELNQVTEPNDRWRRMVELNATEQALNIASTSVVQDSWQANDGYPHIHAWVYDIGEGHIQEIALDIKSHLKVNDIFKFKSNDDPAKPIVPTVQSESPFLPGTR